MIMREISCATTNVKPHVAVVDASLNVTLAFPLVTHRCNAEFADKFWFAQRGGNVSCVVGGSGPYGHPILKIGKPKAA